MSDPCLIPGIAYIAGPPLIGFLLNWGLFGVISIQVYLYYLAFPTDRPFIQCLVYTTYLMEAAQTLMLTDSAFQMFAYGYGDVVALETIGTIWISIGILGAISACSVQSFYAYRVLAMSDKRHISGAILLLALLAMGGSLACAVMMHQARFFMNLATTRVWISAGIWEGSAVACNVLIAISMTYYFIKRARNSPIVHTQVFARTIVRFTIETGALTAVISIVSLVVTFLLGRPHYYQTLEAVLVKLYATTLMVLLNSRMTIGTIADSPAWNEVSAPSEPDADAAARSGPEFGGATSSASTARFSGSERTAVGEGVEGKMVFAEIEEEEPRGSEPVDEASRPDSPTIV